MYSPDDANYVAEDDKLRSSYMRNLVHGLYPTKPSPEPVTIPKVIIQYWHDLDALPSDVGECLESWTTLGGIGFERLIFDDREARRYIAKDFGDPYVAAFDRCGHPAMRCDYFRLCYILVNGGFYVDADEVYQGGDCQPLYRDNKIKLQPLCYDCLTDTMVESEVFIKNRSYSPDWIFYVNNNPIVAPPSHPVVQLALTRSTRLLLTQGNQIRDIQSTTGPGNLTASLVRHSIACGREGLSSDFHLLENWETISTCRWPLGYRDDERNWRHWSASG